ncbi:hypothetical protein [Bacillus massilinigeriensis]|uniref:hypothetical protein n=1 Tax=Bacillus massilionigeriensis TaxID=1805475 RepID=UPI00096B55B4|nr:hypothetical protein [Bacillus massilionigeriensis]
MIKILFTGFMLLVLMLSPFHNASAQKENLFTPKIIQAGSRTTYEMNLKMEKDGSFQITSTAKVKNISNDTWDEIPFSFIPNVFSKDYYPNKYPMAI